MNKNSTVKVLSALSLSFTGLILTQSLNASSTPGASTSVPNKAVPNKTVPNKIVPNKAVPNKGAAAILSKLETESNKIRSTYLCSIKEIFETVFNDFKKGHFGDPLDDGRISATIEAFEKALKKVQQGGDMGMLLSTVEKIKQELNKPLIEKAFELLDLPYHEISQKKLRWTLRKKIKYPKTHPKEGKLIPKAERDKFFKAVDVIEASDKCIRDEVSNSVPQKRDYELLNLKPGASRREIKEAYNREAMKFHPDKFDIRRQDADYPYQTREEAEERFKDVSNAYERLKQNINIK
ncbi:MAG: DnaJ domain-containing protein [Puniceicoccales bacterium]|nr:DnaJ domain-containing protein [Puniceicoccales bacterium]